MAHYKGTRAKYEHFDIMDAIQSYYNSFGSSNANVALQSTGIAKVMAGFAEIGMSGIKPEEISRLLPSDGMGPALVIMADVRAYFQGKL